MAAATSTIYPAGLRRGGRKRSRRSAGPRRMWRVRPASAGLRCRISSEKQGVNALAALARLRQMRAVLLDDETLREARDEDFDASGTFVRRADRAAPAGGYDDGQGSSGGHEASSFGHGDESFAHQRDRAHGLFSGYSRELLRLRQSLSRSLTKGESDGPTKAQFLLGALAQRARTDASVLDPPHMLPGVIALSEEDDEDARYIWLCERPGRMDALAYSIGEADAASSGRQTDATNCYFPRRSGASGGVGSLRRRSRTLCARSVASGCARALSGCNCSTIGAQGVTAASRAMRCKEAPPVAQHAPPHPTPSTRPLSGAARATATVESICSETPPSCSSGRRSRRPPLSAPRSRRTAPPFDVAAAAAMSRARRQCPRRRRFGCHSCAAEPVALGGCRGQAVWPRVGRKAACGGGSS